MMYQEYVYKELEEINEAVKQASALKGCISADTERTVDKIEKINELLEKAVIASRNTLEQIIPEGMYANNNLKTPINSYTHISGTIRIINYGWLHIKLNTLLPHCRFNSPVYLSDTISLLLNSFVESGGKLPYYEKAMLIIDEHCNCKNRTVFDQDNKGWKVISNTLKGRLFPDDDQFTLGISLISTESENLESNIYVLNLEEAGEFFDMRYSGLLY